MEIKYYIYYLYLLLLHISKDFNIWKNFLTKNFKR